MSFDLTHAIVASIMGSLTQRQPMTDTLENTSTRRATPLRVILVAIFIGMSVSTDPSLSPPSSSKTCNGKAMSSHALSIHRKYYMKHPPHDTTLYDLLGVSPSASAGEITRKYRAQKARLELRRHQVSAKTNSYQPHHEPSTGNHGETPFTHRPVSTSPELSSTCQGPSVSALDIVSDVMLVVSPAEYAARQRRKRRRERREELYRKTGRRIRKSCREQDQEYERLGIRPFAPTVLVVPPPERDSSTRGAAAKSPDVSPQPYRLPTPWDLEETYVNDTLGKLHEAFEILRNDTLRIPYHKYGLFNVSQALEILTGCRGADDFSLDSQDGGEDRAAALEELYELMGFSSADRTQDDPEFSGVMTIDEWLEVRNSIHLDGRGNSDADGTTQPNPADTESVRICQVAIRMLERIRPFVEEIVPVYVWLDDLVQQCDRVKRAPLGAHVLRCLGRAYRYSGQRYLRQHDPSNQYQQRSRSTINYNFPAHRRRHGRAASSVGGEASLPADDDTDDLYYDRHFLMTPAPMETLAVHETYLTCDQRPRLVPLGMALGHHLTTAKYRVAAAVAQGIVQASELQVQLAHVTERVAKEVNESELKARLIQTAKVRASTLTSCLHRTTAFVTKEIQVSKVSQWLAQAAENMSREISLVIPVNLHSFERQPSFVGRKSKLASILRAERTQDAPETFPELPHPKECDLDQLKSLRKRDANSTQVKSNIVKSANRSSHQARPHEADADPEFDPCTSALTEEWTDKKATLSSLHIDALWKTCKIELDRIARHGCDLVLYGRHFYDSPVATGDSHVAGNGHDGWISRRSGMGITAQEGRIRAARAMVLMGNIFIQRSKEGTTWKR
jgi:hypothetical protein